MKPHTLPVKRRPVPKGIFKRLSAVTGNRKQRVAAAAASEMDGEDGSSKISRALTIIFLIHIVAIGLIFVHQKFLADRVPAAETETVPVAAPEPRRQDSRRLSSGEAGYIVKAGDNFARIAAAEGVDEAELKAANEDVEFKSGVILRLPPKRMAAVASAEPISDPVEAEPAPDSGLVPAIPVDVAGAPRAQLVRPNTTAASASGDSYVVQSGDSIWRIANRFQVNQDALMKANNISDPRKMKVGMTLSIPR